MPKGTKKDVVRFDHQKFVADVIHGYYRAVPTEVNKNTLPDITDFVIEFSQKLEKAVFAE